MLSYHPFPGKILRAAALPHQYENLRLLLEEQHDFPGPYTFKVIGPNTPDWQEQAVSAALAPLAEAQKRIEQIERKVSAGGRYAAVSLTLNLADSGQALAVYDSLGKLEHLKMLL
jgi:putative lipoic acid-binding regulatory protein